MDINRVLVTGGAGFIGSHLVDAHDFSNLLPEENPLTDDLKGLINKYEERATMMSGMYDVEDVSLAKNYAIVQVDQDLRILSIMERTDNSETTLESGIYLLVKLIAHLQIHAPWGMV